MVRVLACVAKVTSPYHRILEPEKRMTLVVW